MENLNSLLLHQGSLLLFQFTLLACNCGLRPHCLLGPPYERTCLMRGHHFLDYMSFRMTCIMIAYVLREVMLCYRKCLIGCHVLVESMSSGWHILQYVVFY